MPTKCNKNIHARTSLVIQWLRLHTFTAGVHIPSLFGELKSLGWPSVAKNLSKHFLKIYKPLQRRHTDG